MPVRAEFIFSSGSRELHAHGVRETITVPAVNGDAADSPLQQQVRAAFDRARKAGMENPVIVGAIPFDVNQPSQLYVPETAAWQEADPSTHAQAMPMPALRSMDTVPDQHGFQQGVANAIAAFPAEGIHKVVLSITSRLHFTEAVPVAALRTNLRRLNPSGYLFQVPLPGNIHLVGVSPELLIEKHGATVQSNPLAGSARRQADPAEDQATAERLSASGKDHHEHQFVTADIRARLEPLCATLDVPARPSLIHTAALWHLSTRIRGELQDPQTNALQLACCIHPTPAVCGTPRDAAHALIRRIEPYDRGLFTGIVGWMDAQGNGEWVVTLRCGVLWVVGLSGLGYLIGNNDWVKAHFSWVTLAMMRDTIRSCSMSGLAPPPPRIPGTASRRESCSLTRPLRMRCW